MQEMLLGFQADLGGISDEIKHLQVTFAPKFCRKLCNLGCVTFDELDRLSSSYFFQSKISPNS